MSDEPRAGAPRGLEHGQLAYLQIPALDVRRSGDHESRLGRLEHRSKIADR